MEQGIEPDIIPIDFRMTFSEGTGFATPTGFAGHAGAITTKTNIRPDHQIWAAQVTPA
jgi:hypothetical protein